MSMYLTVASGRDAAPFGCAAAAGFVLAPGGNRLAQAVPVPSPAGKSAMLGSEPDVVISDVWCDPTWVGSAPVVARRAGEMGVARIRMQATSDGGRAVRALLAAAVVTAGLLPPTVVAAAGEDVSTQTSGATRDEEPGASREGRGGGTDGDDATVGPLIAGTGSYVDWTYAWTDYVYDDRGPDGEATYPEEPRNLADLVQLQLAREDGRWVVRAVLQTLLEEHWDAPLLGVGLDLDADLATGAAAPPGSWEPAEPLGLERLLLVSDGGAELRRWTGTSWEHERDLAARVDPATNVLEAPLPAGLLERSGPEVRMVGLLGLGMAGHSWVDGDGPVHDLAFVGDEPPRGWQDERQAAILAGRDPGGVGEIDLRRIRADETLLATADEPGFHTLLYHSELDLGEGIRTAHLETAGGGELPFSDLYAGPYQPYLVWLPDDLPDDRPLVVYLHGLSQTHTSNTGAFGPGGFAPKAVVVQPLGRGEMTFFIGEGEQDVLDVVDDASAHYAVNPDRVVLSGLSMGGFGTYRLGVRYPDRFTALVPFIGTGLGAQHQFRALPPEVVDEVFPPDRFPSGSNELLANVRNVPVRIVNGQLDPIVTYAFAKQDALRLHELGYDHRFWNLARRSHEVVASLSGCILEEAIEQPRVIDPARVTYQVRPATFMVDGETGLDLRYDGAYWVSEIAAADDVGSETATVDVVTLDRPDREPARSPVLEVGQNLVAGADLCGPADVRTGDAWRMTGLAWNPGPAAPTSNAARADLDEVVALALDLERMDLDVGRRLELEVTTTRDVLVHLDADWPGPVAVSVDGQEARHLVPEVGRVTVEIPVGERVVVLEPGG